MNTSITNSKKIMAMSMHGTWGHKNQPPPRTLKDFCTQLSIPQKVGKPFTAVEAAISKLSNGFILSLDNKATPEETELQKHSGITIYYKTEWRKLFNTLTIEILQKFIREEQKVEKDILLLYIISVMCRYSLVYDSTTIHQIIFKYKIYIKKHNDQLPKIVIIAATPPGKSISNCEEYMKSKLDPHISGKNLLHLFPGQSETNILSQTIIKLLNKLTNKDRSEISKNLKGWLETNPETELAQLLKTSSPTPVKIPYYKSICLCKKCKFTVSDSGIDEFLEKNHISSLRNKNNDLLLKIKPTGDLLTIGKILLYIQCHACDSLISMSSIIPKYLDMSKDEKTDESYKIAKKAKLYLYKIIEQLTKSTLDKQFPDFKCCVCLTDHLSYEQVHHNQECNHLSCICLDCNDTKTVQGRAIKGNFYLNSNYQCLGCTAFEPTGNLYIDEFNKTGGVQPGYVGRFCLECIKPFQEKPETCGVEQGNTDISLYCIDCTIQLAEYNKKIRLTVTCPNSSCNTPISRYEGCDVVECLECNIQFCYGCEYIFINPPDFEWNWTCSCLINNYSRPKQYNDKSQSTCKGSYFAYQWGRGIRMEELLPVPEPEHEPVLPQLPVPEPEHEPVLPQLPVPEPELSVPEPELSVPEPELSVPEPELPVPEPELPVPEPELPVPEPELLVPELPEPELVIRENINININIYNNIIVNNPPFQERIIDEEDIQRQILLAENMGDDFSQLY
jgi:hypothetical protein